MGDQSSGSLMMEVAAARALQWNVDFDRGLRSPKPGAQCEAVLKLGPQLVRWSHNCIVTAASANLFKLEPGQDRVFANAILLRLADTFRSGNNFIRVCILKVLMLEFKARGLIGEIFTADNFEKVIATKKSYLDGSHSQAVRRKQWGGKGLLTKKRIANHVEMLRRVKSVIDSGDPTSRAMALRVLGCLADLGKDSVDVHNLVLQAVHSPHHQEVSAAFFAMGCLAELSEEFAGHSLRKAFEMVNAMETPPEVKILAVRLFAKLGHLPILSLQAHEMGRKLILRYPTHAIVTTMLISLTMLAAESSVIMGSQVDLLLKYLDSDPRMNVRAVALKCLGKLLPQAFCCINTSFDSFSRVFSVVQDPALPSALHVLALQVIRKLFHQFVITMELKSLLEIMSWIELTVLRGVWPVTSRALSLLVDMVCDVVKLKLTSVPPEQRTELVDFSRRVCLLLCDQVSIIGGSAVRSQESSSRQSSLRSSAVFMEDEEPICLAKTKASTISVLLVKLVKGYQSVGWIVVDSVAGIMEVLAQRNADQRKESVCEDGSQMDIDHDSIAQEKDGGHAPTESSGVTPESVKRICVDGEVDVVLVELGRCLSACVPLLEYRERNIEDVHRRLHLLTSELISVNTPASVLIPVLEALMKASLVHESLTTMTDADGGSEWPERKNRLIVESRSILQKLGRKLVQGSSFWVAYEIGKRAAVCGLWGLAGSNFASLVDKVSSEGSYFWLRALSYQSKAESFLEIANNAHKWDIEKDVEHNGVSASTVFFSENEANRSKDMLSSGDAGDSLPSTGIHHPANMQESYLGRLGIAAALAMPLLRNSVTCLSSGVCLDCMFEFQRWVLALRLEELECVSELVGLLAHISSLDADAGILDLEHEGKNHEVKRLASALKGSTEKVQLLASRLTKLSQEYDLLSISFMGIDQRSNAMLLRAALLCSLLAFCSIRVFFPQPASQLSVDTTVNLGSLALDLFHRLQQIESGDWNNLLSFAIESGDGVVRRRVFCGPLVAESQETAMVNLSRWAITSILGIQKQQSLVGVLRGTKLLQHILEECLHIPWVSPPFFFCTRPRTGVELFLAEAGPSTGETGDLSVMQGSALSLSVCLQIVNIPLQYRACLRRVVCALSIQQTEGNRKLNDEVDVSTKAGSLVHHPLHPALIEKLIIYSKGLTAPNFDRGESTVVSGGQSVSSGKSQLAPDLFFSVSVDAKGQGFASCTLDVTKVSCGEFHLSLSCICLDNKGGLWILPLLSARPVLRIT